MSLSAPRSRPAVRQNGPGRERQLPARMFSDWPRPGADFVFLADRYAGELPFGRFVTIGDVDYNALPPGDAELPGILSDLIDRAQHVDVDVRRDAIEKIYELALKVKAKAASAIPCLVGGLVDPDPRIGESASWALHYCAPESIDPLVECLTHPVSFVRERASHALGNIGNTARAAAAPRLRDLLKDPDQAVRQRAAWALGLLHDTWGDTLRILAGMVTNGTPADAGAALHALGNIGKSAGPDFLTPYREVVLAATHSPATDVRRWALYAAESIGLDRQTWADTLASIVRQDESAEVRTAALSALKDIAPSVELASAVPTMVARLSEAGREASLVCDILAAMHPRPMSAVPLLRALLSRDELVIPAASALWRIEGRAGVIVPALRRVFADNGESVCDLICELGPAAQDLVPDIIRALAEDNWDLQWAAADALRAIASSEVTVQRALLDALDHPSPIVRSASARALAATGAMAVRPLNALLVDASDPRASLAAFALGEIGPAAGEALANLRAGMRSGSEPMAGCCAIALVRIAAEVAAVPYLAATLSSEDPAAPRKAAAEALGDLGPAASAAIEALEALADDEDFDVADASAQALMAIRERSH
jgi:HEAT repeat protein